MVFACTHGLGRKEAKRPDPEHCLGLQRLAEQWWLAAFKGTIPACLPMGRQGVGKRTRCLVS
jgi:hypothetical protein